MLKSRVMTHSRSFLVQIMKTDVYRCLGARTLGMLVGGKQEDTAQWEQSEHRKEEDGDA